MKQENQNELVKYSDLSMPLKFLVVCCWILAGFYILAFGIGILVTLFP